MYEFTASVVINEYRPIGGKEGRGLDHWRRRWEGQEWRRMEGRKEMGYRGGNTGNL